MQAETRSNVLIVGGFDRSLEDWDKRKKIESTLYEAGFGDEDFTSICWDNEERGMAIEFRSRVVANTTLWRLKTINRLRAPAAMAHSLDEKMQG